jgi:hypothetical protein
LKFYFLLILHNRANKLQGKDLEELGLLDDLAQYFEMQLSRYVSEQQLVGNKMVIQHKI